MNAAHWSGSAWCSGPSSGSPGRIRMRLKAIPFRLTDAISLSVDAIWRSHAARAWPTVTLKTPLVSV